ncbi:hypothetical protein PAF17_06735 [Paracoccus sp. Z330]|uniref:Ca-activated chloride channel family protein n=1 Tax=Paracoccus onchidii TaxID=3017813 RepID=A0ABT4ZDZ0_9RHOB|nr:hypothetical protein [Paracoccus onchidii]MDB6177203.1 hypothetical protein [Paracoccus onchidii]
MRSALFVALLAILMLMAAGPNALGRLALRAGWNGIATRILHDPAARGVAQYRAGAYQEADASFAAAGRSQTYNRGLSLAATGDYSLSVAYFDAMLFADPADEQARRNRQIVAAMYPPVRGQTVVPGRISGAGGITTDAPIIADLLANASGPEWERKLDNKGITASDIWLQTISDDPGEFLKLRLRAEYDRRAQLGLIRPSEGEPW